MPRTTPTEPTCEGVVIYAHGQHPAEITRQNATLRHYCQQAGLEVITEFHDLTGQTIGLDMALHAAEDPCVRYLCTTSWPPATLDTEETLSVTELLAHNHTRLVTIDNQPPAGRPDSGTDDDRRLS